MDNGHSISISPLVIVELLVQNLATQRAFNKTITEVLSKSDSHADEIMSALNSETKVETKRVLDHLYARHGSIDWRDLLGML